ncbi:YdeI/OmpD-associated family protein [Streptomyces sp. RFCAC02]|uniref:YdeI/OmpD-associated family protein n=1 Tax=Streptomyces sp. RFCAC02 TaxID=2499143 RepID=UPI00101F6A74|nr:YdeI/OmpD-associated family protein [Streptomyces sp. RFCAC02]
MPDDLPTLSFDTAADFETWLAEHHASSPGIWLKLRKKTPGGAAGFDYAQALDVALCHGWIDGRKAAYDDRHWLQRFTPRRPDSAWSKVNRTKAEALIADGRMRPAGAAEIERARADGRWAAAYDGMAGSTVPDDLAAALAANPAAAEFFAKLDGRNRYSVLYRVQTAKKAETRQRRIEQYVAMLAEGRSIHP